MNSLSTECTSHKKKFKRILAANVLRFHGSFLEIIGNEPSGKYKDPTHNYFHHKIISVLADTKNSIDTFHKWQDEVIAGFNKINGWLLTLQNLVKVLQKGMLIVVPLLGQLVRKARRLGD